MTDVETKPTSWFRIAGALAAMAVITLTGFVPVASAQLAGTKNIPGDYPTLAAAIADLNTQGVGVGGVTLNLVAGNPETAPAGGYVVGGTGSLVLTTSSASQPVVLQGNGNTITAANPQAAGSVNDAIFKLIGADWVTITGFTIRENPSNNTTALATNNMTEWAIALLYVTTSDGAQNNTIQANTISLTRTYTNSFAIYSNVRHSPSAVTVAADIVNGTTAPNSGNRVLGNTITNVNQAIAFIGSATAANQDVGNDVGGVLVATGNAISNWGGAAALTGYVSNSASSYGILMNHQVGENVAFNILTSASVGPSVAFRGIYKTYTSAAPVGTFTTRIANNTVTMTSAQTNGTFQGISSDGMTALPTATMHVDSNTVLNSAVTAAFGAPTITGIVNSCAPGTLTMNGNVIRGCTSTGGGGGFLGISNQGVVVNSVSLDNNQLGNGLGNAITFTGATSGNLSGITNSSPATATASVSGNNIQGFVQTAAGSGAHSYISNAASGSSTTDNNTFTNLNANTSANVYFLGVGITHAAGTVHTMSGNRIVGAFTKSGVGAQLAIHFTNASSGSSVTETWSGNDFSNMTVSGATQIAALTCTDAGAVTNITGNTFNNIQGGTNLIQVMSAGASSNGTVSGNTISGVTSDGNITGIISSSGTQTISNNTIAGLSSTGASSSVNGIFVNGGTSQVVENNTVHGLTGSGATAPVLYGIFVSNPSSIQVRGNKVYDLVESEVLSTTSTPPVIGLNLRVGTTVTAYNNLVGDLRAPKANSDSIMVCGIGLPEGFPSSAFNVYFNTVYLNATSSGANFSTAGIYHAASATPTTEALDLRNNVIVNLSTPKGTGRTSAYRIRGGALGNYAASSDRNLFYAGTPGPNRLIFDDGTNADQTLSAFQARVAPREAASVTENPPFLSTTGPSAQFLHIDPSVVTLIEGGASPIAGITTDFDGDTRNVSTPDIGADEGAFTGIAGVVNLSPTVAFAATPNPFVGSSTLSFSLVREEDLELAIFSVDGRRVRTLIRESRGVGTHRVTWDGTNDRGAEMGPGVYYARLETAQGRQTRVLTLLK